MKPNNKRIVVTGATGFIGEHVIRRLVQTGLSPAMAARTPEHVSLDFKHLAFHKMDLLDINSINNVLATYDCVIHLAGRTGPGHIEDPVHDFKMNALGSLNLFQAAKNNNIKRLVNVSSYEVYGKPQSNTIDEDHPTAPLNPYGASLLTRELYAQIFRQNFGLNISTLRIFNAYGPAISARNQKGVIPFLINACESNEPINLSGRPDLTRDFIYIEDVADIIIKTLFADDMIEQSINIGSGVGTSLKELIELIQKMMDCNQECNFKFNSSDPISKVVANNDKLINALRYELKYSLEDGLNQMLAKRSVAI